jgi:hypothetical protein
MQNFVCWCVGDTPYELASAVSSRSAPDRNRAKASSLVRYADMNITPLHEKLIAPQDTIEDTQRPASPAAGGTQIPFGIRTNFGMLIIQFRGQNPCRRVQAMVRLFIEIKFLPLSCQQKVVRDSGVILLSLAQL